jgi:hypothetical protein
MWNLIPASLEVAEYMFQYAREGSGGRDTIEN